MSIFGYITTAAIGLLLFIHWQFRQDVLFPPFVNAAVWLIVLLLYGVGFGLNMPVLSPETLTIIFSSLIAFSLGGWIATYRRQPPLKVFPRHNAGDSRAVMGGLLLVSAIGAPLLLAKAMNIASGGPIGNFMIDLRLALNYGGASYGALAYLSIIPIISVFYYGIFRVKRQRLIVITSISLALFYAVLSTGRGAVFVIVISFAAITLITRRVRPITLVPIFAGISIFIFALFSILLLKGGSADGSFHSNIESIGGVFMQYILSPIAAFDQYLGLNDPTYSMDFILRFLHAVMAALNYDTEPIQLIQPYAFVPFPTNVYTYFQPYYIDLGIYGILMFSMLFGYIHSTAYVAACDGHPTGVFIYAILTYPLLLQFFQDGYIMNTSLWIQYIGAWLILRIIDSVGPLLKSRAMLLRNQVR